MSSIAPTKLRDKPNEFGIDVVFLAISLLRHKQPKGINKKKPAGLSIYRLFYF